MTIAGTEMQCLEIYTGEAYTFPIAFTDSNGNAANASIPNAWSLSASAKFYSVDNVVYVDADNVQLGNLNLISPQPANTAYTVIAEWTAINSGLAYLHIGSDITNSGNNTPNVTLANSAANSTLVIVTLEIQKESAANASLVDINREPLGFIVRYQ